MTTLAYAPKPTDASHVRSDFFSDTRCKPTPGMLDAMVRAKVGDEQKGEDPTTNELCDRVAALLGKEAAVLLPTGTMCNQIALRIHCEPGDEVICESGCHIVNFESGGPAALSGVMLRGIDGDNGVFSADQVRQAVRPVSRYAPRSRLLTVEQTANRGGGKVWPLETLTAVAAEAKRHGLATHMDGARLLNASVAAGVSPKAFAQGFDSAWIDLSKGLGSFAGGVLAGSHAFIDTAWRLKQQWGAALRQSGYLAATGVYALEHHVVRMADDHGRARQIGKAIADHPMIESLLPVETNIVIFDIAAQGPTAQQVFDRLLRHGLRIGILAERTIRIVTHLGVDQAQVDELCGLLPSALSK